MKGDRLYLTHIMDAREKVETYISVGHDVFASTSHWQAAVIRQLEIIGGGNQAAVEAVLFATSRSPMAPHSRATRRFDS